MSSGFGLVVSKKNEILLIQRAYGRHKGKWSLPGGHQDRGESRKRTAVREMQEETGIRMSADSLYYKRTYRSGDKVEVWSGKCIGGRLKIQKHECLDAKWFRKDMLPHDDNLAFGFDKAVLRKWAKENRGSRRVHYPHRVQMRRAGYALVVNDRKEILLFKRRGGNRPGKWRLPGGEAGQGQKRRDAASQKTMQSTGIKFYPERLYYTNRYRAQIWQGKFKGTSNGRSKWFPIDKLPDDKSLAYAVDVRTVEKWASENRGSRRVSY